MNKVASYLQGHVAGEVIASEKVRQQFSRDASVLQMKPNLVVYPRTTNDVRKVLRFSWQLAEKGHVLPVTARGNGTDLTGAAIGKGVVIAFPAHLNRILELDTKQKLVRVQPGVNFKSLQETLHTHGLFLPPFPSSFEYSTVGGAIANNTAGVKSFKYGSMRGWVDRLEVVLANGEIIQTGPLTKKQLNSKLGAATLEGELYRAVNAILNDSRSVIDNYYARLKVEADSVGYAIDAVSKDGKIDLTPLFVGAQGTLGVITEAILKVAPYTPVTKLVVATFAKPEEAYVAAARVEALHPSVLEIVDGDMLEFVRKNHNVNLPSKLTGQKQPGAVLFIECDEKSSRAKTKFVKKAYKLLRDMAVSIVDSEDFDELERLWALRYVTASFMSHDEHGVSAVPVIEDAAVPVDLLPAFVEDAKALAKKYSLESAVWVHALDGNVHVMPLVDLSKAHERQKLIKMMDEYYRMVIKIGGSIASEHGDGRLRAPFTKLQAGDDLMAVFTDLRKAVDPHGTMNPGVKTGTSIRQLVDDLAHDYSLSRFADYLPKM